MTNAGKTFTVLGSDDNPGLLIRAVSDCIAVVREANAAPRVNSISPRALPNAIVPDIDSAESDITDDMLGRDAAADGSKDAKRLPELRPGESLALSLSCLEIYNEQVFDVLAPPTELGGARPILKIKDDISGRCVSLTATVFNW